MDRLHIEIVNGTKKGVKVKRIGVFVDGEWDESIPVSLDFPTTLTFPELIVELIRLSLTNEGGENWTAIMARNAIDSLRRYGGCEFNGQFFVWNEVDWREVGNLVLGVRQHNG